MSDLAPIYDAHCHWHDERLAGTQADIQAALAKTGLTRAVVNGTHPGDWEAVAQLAEVDDRVIPAFGLHPWRVNDAPTDWLEQLRGYLARFPRAGVGEVGLDRWIADHDLPRQQAALQAQLELAAADNRPVSLHCLQAWGPMLEQLQRGPLPARGVHLHAYGGSPEMVAQFAELGAYFSFSAYIMHERKRRCREAVQAVPLARLLAETDAPDMLPPADWRDAPLSGEAPFAHAPEGEGMHSPANITASYRAIAQLREIAVEEVSSVIADNFRRYFLEA